MSVSIFGVIKSGLIPLLIILTVVFVALASTRRDSTYYHWLSVCIDPVTIKFLPAKKVDSQSQPSGLIENFEAGKIDSQWQWFQPELVAANFSDGALELETLSESVWFHNVRGPMLFRDFSGDGAISVVVKTRKSSDDNSYPDDQWQFGGIMLRNPTGDAWFSRENYVFNVIGFRHKSLQVEIKSTRQGRSDVSGFDWVSGDAELMIERRGALFVMKARPVEGGQWQTMGEYRRPDLPSDLQLGIIVYSYSEGRGIVDLKSTFERLEVKAL